MYLIDDAILFDYVRELYAKISLNKNNGKLTLPPFRYILDLTYRCNLKCPHCYIDKGFQNKDELSLNEWIKIIKQIPNYGIISLIGGETFIREDFFDIAKQASNHTFGKINTYSNGLLLNKELLQKLFSVKMLLFAISIDGFGSRHDDSRGHKGLFDNILNSLDIIKTAKISKKIDGKKVNMPLVEINTVVLENNLDDLPLLYKLAAESRMDYIGFLFKRINYRQNPKYMNNLDESIYDKDYSYPVYFDLEHFNEIYKELNSLTKKYKTKIRWSPRFNNLEEINYTFNNINTDVNKLFKPCKMPMHDIFIDPEGTVYPCIPLNMGNLRRESLKSIINNEKFCSFRKKLNDEKLFKFCNMCCDLFPADSN